MNKKRNRNKNINRLSIFYDDCILFDKVWKWKKDQHLAECSSTLNHFFHQLAVTIEPNKDDTHISHIVFNDQNLSTDSTKMLNTSFERHRMYTLQRKRIENQKKKMQMFSYHFNQHIKCNIYIDADYQLYYDIEKYAMDVLNLFHQKYQNFDHIQDFLSTYTKEIDKYLDFLKIYDDFHHNIDHEISIDDYKVYDLLTDNIYNSPIVKNNEVERKSSISQILEEIDLFQHNDENDDDLKEEN